MKYALLIYPKPGSHEGLADEDATALTAEYLALRADSRCVGGAHLQPGAAAGYPGRAGTWLACAPATRPVWV